MLYGSGMIRLSCDTHITNWCITYSQISRQMISWTSFSLVIQGTRKHMMQNFISNMFHRYPEISCKISLYRFDKIVDKFKTCPSVEFQKDYELTSLVIRDMLCVYQ